MNVFRAALICRIVVVITLAGGTSLAAGDPLYALCGAYEPEMVALRKEFGVNETGGFTRSVVKGVEFLRGRFGKKEVVVFQTGVSLVNAAHRLQIALDHFPITHLLFAGVAGGTDPAFHIGDVVIPESWAYHSESVYLNEDGRGGYVVPPYFRPSYENFGIMFPDDVSVATARSADARPAKIARFTADGGMLAAAAKAVPSIPTMRKAGRAITINVGGVGVSGPVFLDNAKYREWVFRVWKARCVDMESAALAHVAYANGTPFLIVRGLSDLAGGQRGANPIDDNEAAVSEIAARVLRKIVEEL